MPVCQGLGVQRNFSPDLVIDRLASQRRMHPPVPPLDDVGWYRSQMTQTCEHYGISTDVPFGDLDEDAQDILLHGSGSTEINFNFVSQKGSSYRMVRPWEGVFARLRRTYTDTSSNRTRSRLTSYMTDEPCTDCGGRKLNRAVSMVTVEASHYPLSFVAFRSSSRGSTLAPRCFG